MIQKFVNAYMAKKDVLREKFTNAHPGYKDIVQAVVEVIRDEDGYDEPDPTRIHEIDDGDYQGTLLYVIAANSYQPWTYWFVKVGYGSCSGCDTLQSIRDDYTECWADYDKPSEKQVDAYMTLALHIVQGIKLMGEA